MNLNRPEMAKKLIKIGQIWFKNKISLNGLETYQKRSKKVKDLLEMIRNSSQRSQNHQKNGRIMVSFMSRTGRRMQGMSSWVLSGQTLKITHVP